MRLASGIVILSANIGMATAQCHDGVIAASVLVPIVVLLFVFFGVLCCLYKAKRLVLWPVEKSLTGDKADDAVLKTPSKAKPQINMAYNADGDAEAGFGDLPRRGQNGSAPKSVDEIDPGRVTVTLTGRDNVGLGFTVTGGQSFDIVVDAVKASGPAGESNVIHTGDVITSLKIYFDKMNLEDALTFLSYAGKYRVTLELLKKATELESIVNERTPDIREILVDQPSQELPQNGYGKTVAGSGVCDNTANETVPDVPPVQSVDDGVINEKNSTPEKAKFKERIDSDRVGVNDPESDDILYQSNVNKENIGNPTNESDSDFYNVSRLDDSSLDTASNVSNSITIAGQRHQEVPSPGSDRHLFDASKTFDMMLEKTKMIQNDERSVCSFDDTIGIDQSANEDIPGDIPSNDAEDTPPPLPSFPPPSESPDRIQFPQTAIFPDYEQSQDFIFVQGKTQALPEDVDEVQVGVSDSLHEDTLQKECLSREIGWQDGFTEKREKTENTEGDSVGLSTALELQLIQDKDINVDQSDGGPNPTKADEDEIPMESIDRNVAINFQALDKIDANSANTGTGTVVADDAPSFVLDDWAPVVSTDIDTNDDKYNTHLKLEDDDEDSPRRYYRNDVTLLVDNNGEELNVQSVDTQATEMSDGATSDDGCMQIDEYPLDDEFTNLDPMLPQIRIQGEHDADDSMQSPDTSYWSNESSYLSSYDVVVPMSSDRDCDNNIDTVTVSDSYETTDSRSNGSTIPDHYNNTLELATVEDYNVCDAYEGGDGDATIEIVVGAKETDSNRDVGDPNMVPVWDTMAYPEADSQARSRTSSASSKCSSNGKINEDDTPPPIKIHSEFSKARENLTRLSNSSLSSAASVERDAMST